MSSKRVSFSTVSVRKHGIMVGSSTYRAGNSPLIMLDWNHEDVEILAVDDYEAQRLPSAKILKSTTGERQKMLMVHFGYTTIQDLAQNIRRNRMIRDDRRHRILSRDTGIDGDIECWRDGPGQHEKNMDAHTHTRDPIQ